MQKETHLAEAKDIEWKEGSVENLPFEDETFDVVMLSILGHIFASHPQVEIKEILQVTKNKGGRIAFATWPSELANGKLLKVLENIGLILLMVMIHHNKQYFHCNGEFLRPCRNDLVASVQKLSTLSVSIE